MSFYTFGSCRVFSARASVHRDRAVMALVAPALAFGALGTSGCYLSHSAREEPDRTDASDAGDTGDTAVVPADGDVVDPVTGSSRLTAGNRHTCAVWPDRTVRCWGSNERGELGDGTTDPREAPVQVVGLDSVVEVAAGVSHTCGLLSDGTVRCWGYDDQGQLGDGEATLTPRTIPVEVVGLSDVVQIDAGNWHTCAVIGDGTVRCWGWNNAAELGDGTTTRRTTPVRVAGLEDVVEVAAGLEHSCARLRDGTVRCWGRELAVVLPDGSVPIRAAPVPIDGVSGVVGLGAGYGYVCAVLADGAVRCWGSNGNGQLGDGTRTHRVTPVAAPTIASALEIDAGGATCARLSDGTVRCWGAWDSAFPIPFVVDGVEDAVEIAVGGGHGCARLADGSFRCWGYNSDGQTMAGGCCYEGLCGIPDGASCGAMGTCSDGWCSGCGGPGQPCCDLAAPRRCRDESPLCDDAGICVACGGLGQPCCGGSLCTTSDATCFLGRCVLPGASGGPCLPDGVCPGGCCVLDFDRVCVGVTSACPGPDGAASGTCMSGGSCGGCGGIGQPCCPSPSTRVPFYCSAPGASCGADTICATG